MDWINININVIRGEEYIDAEPVSRATWLSLTAWCCSQENGGVIIGARSWTDRKWQQLCGVTLAEVETMCLLYGFEGENLVVHFYPVEQEAKVIKNRENGSKGGRPKKKVAPQVPDTQGEKPCGLPSGSDPLKRNSNSNSNSNSKVKAYYTESEGLVVPQVFLDKMITTYPKLSVSKEIIAQEAWLLANPKKRKKNYETFINNWLSRANDNVKDNNQWIL